MRAPASSEWRGPGVVLLLLAAVALTGCAPKTALVALPGGQGQPLDAATRDAYADAMAEPCRSLQALTADLRIAGRVDGERVRGTLQVGVDGKGLRLEGVPPFGAPVFILAGPTDAATLLFPRDEVYVRNASVADLTDAVVGVALAPADLLALLGGCGVPAGDVVSGAVFGDRWVRLDLRDGVHAWLQPGAGPSGAALRVAETGDWRVDYEPRRTGQPLRGALTRKRSEPVTALSFVVEAPERLAALPAEAFAVNIPTGARPLSLAQVRRQRALADPEG